MTTILTAFFLRRKYETTGRWIMQVVNGIVSSLIPTHWRSSRSITGGVYLWSLLPRGAESFASLNPILMPGAEYEMHCGEEFFGIRSAGSYIANVLMIRNGVQWGANRCNKCKICKISKSL